MNEHTNENGHLKTHPIAEIFPMIEGKEIETLAEDIKANGQVAAIILYEGQILDGRNRYRACQIAGTTPKTRVYDGNDPLGYVLSLNLHRRHLTTSQRSAVAAKIANLPHGNSNRFPKPSKDGLGKPHESLAKSTEKVADDLKVSAASVERARKVAKESPEKFAQVERGEKTVGKALKEIEEEKEKPKIEAALTDELGTVIPSECLDNWHQGNEVADLLSDIRKLKLKVTAAENSEDKLWSRVSWNEVQGKLKSIAYSVGLALPYAVCPMCQGRKQIKCAMCKGFGLLSKFHYQAVPSELRKDQ